MALTDTLIKNTKPKDKPFNMFDGGGLYLQVNPNGSKWWRIKYYFAKKEYRLSFGVYPTISLKEARRRRDEAKEQIAMGINPSSQRKEQKNTVQLEQKAVEGLFENVAKEWFTSYAPSLTPKHAAKLERYLQADILPTLGKLHVDEIEPTDILGVVRPTEADGRITTAHKLMSLCNQVMSHAQLTGRTRYNVVSGLSKALQPIREKNLAAITKPDEIANLLKDIDSLDGASHPPIVFYLKILPYVFTRPTELRRAEWAEVDFDDAILRFPASRMKMRKEHVVPLAKQVIELLEDLHLFSGKGKYLFPSIRANTTTISDAGPLAALRRLGYTKEQMCLHGFRALASTRLNEMGFRGDIIEAQLAHKEPDAVRLVYNRATYMQERRDMMQKWADYLDILKANR